jgi:hypothetical protein
MPLPSSLYSCTVSTFADALSPLGADRLVAGSRLGRVQPRGRDRPDIAIGLVLPIMLIIGRLASAVVCLSLRRARGRRGGAY